MATLSIDDDLYAYIASNTIQIGEDASSILRRLLGIAGTNGRSELAKSPTLDGAAGPLVEVAESSSFRAANATERFLALLSAAFRERPTALGNLENYRSRTRVYFARSRGEIEASGKNCMPKQVPGTDWWVMCNASTAQKSDMLFKALTLLGYEISLAQSLSQRL